MKKKKILLIILISILVIAMASLITSYFLLLHHYKGKEIVNEWHETDEFSLSHIKTVEKKKDKDFTILTLADVQMADLENFFNASIIHSEITYLVEKTNPDLIILTGDQVWSNENLISLKRLINWLDDYKIPYAPIFGNHDYGNSKNSAVASLNYSCDLYEKGKYSLFQRGPSNLGTLGNYVINVVEDNKIYKTIYMLDAGYESILTDEQIAWVKWNAEGIKKANGGTYTEGMAFMHKPIPEYYEAYVKYYRNSDEVEAINDVHVHYSLSGTAQNGFFDLAKQINIIDIVCGHQHGNNFTLKYQGIRLTFALKTGELGGFYNDGITNLNGATTFIINKNNTLIQSTYIEQGQFKIKNSNNVYNK